LIKTKSHSLEKRFDNKIIIKLHRVKKNLLILTHSQSDNDTQFEGDTS